MLSMHYIYYQSKFCFAFSDNQVNYTIFKNEVSSIEQRFSENYNISS